MILLYRLQEIAQISYEEAEAALLETNGQMYEAIDRILLMRSSRQTTPVRFTQHIFWRATLVLR